MKARSHWEQDALEALTELAVGVTTYRLYSAEHPRAELARQRLAAQLEELASRPDTAGRPGELTLVLLGQELFVGDRPFTRTGKQVGGLVRHLRRHRLEHVTFSSGIRPEEVDLLLEFVAGPDDSEPPRCEHIHVGAAVLESGLARGGERAAAERPGVAVRDRLQVVRDACDALRAGDELPVASLTEVVGRIDSQLLRIEDPLTLMARLERDDDWPWVHAHNVAVLALTLAVPFGVGDVERRDLGLGALLHDVGSWTADAAAVARELRHRGPEWELDRDHPRRGLELLVPLSELPPLAPVIAFEHHLGPAGIGFPQLPTPRPPHVAARIVAVAEAFDIMHTVRGPRGAMTREAITAALQAAAGETLDPFFVQAMEVVWELSAEGLQAGADERPAWSEPGRPGSPSQPE